ncbi:hypothetical protein [[Eubacterium] cellulosolvens]
MTPTKIRTTSIIVVFLFIISATLGCTLFDGSDDDDEKREGFTLESLSNTIPSTYSLDQPTIDPRPELNTSVPRPVQSFIASWYFEKNVIYTNYGGVLKAFLQNNGSESLYVYRLGLKPSWDVGEFALNMVDDIVFINVGKYVEPGAKEFIGVLYFPGPSRVGNFEYRIIFSVYEQNSTGAWNDCGDQTGTSKTLEVIEPPEISNYKQHYNLPHYYDKINGIVDPTSERVINLSRTLAGEYSGPFNIYQVCAIFDYISSNIKYISDPSNTENYWCTPDQTLAFGGDCEDFSTLMASLIVSIGGSVRMYLTDSHAFLGLYIGNDPDIQPLITAIQDYYHSNVFIFWFSDELGNWLILDTIGSIYPGGLPLGGAPVMRSYGSSSENYYWTWDFEDTETLYIVDIKPKT